LGKKKVRRGIPGLTQQEGEREERLGVDEHCRGKRARLYPALLGVSNVEDLGWEGVTGIKRKKNGVGGKRRLHERFEVRGIPIRRFRSKPNEGFKGASGTAGSQLKIVSQKHTFERGPLRGGLVGTGTSEGAKKLTPTLKWACSQNPELIPGKNLGKRR